MRKKAWETGELLPRRVIAQIGWTCYAVDMDAFDATGEDRIKALLVRHALGSVLRDHGDDISGNNAMGRRHNYVDLARSLDTFGQPKDGISSNAIFRLRWMLAECGFVLNVRAVWNANEHVANAPKVAAHA